MKRTPVQSSNIESVGYSRVSRVLEVEFKSGAIYQYRDVPRSVADGLRRAESKGRYLNSRVKGKYIFECTHKVVQLPVNPNTDPDPTEPGPVNTPHIEEGDFIRCTLRPFVCGLVQKCSNIIRFNGLPDIKAFTVVLASGKLETIYEPNAQKIA